MRSWHHCLRIRRFGVNQVHGWLGISFIVENPKEKISMESQKFYHFTGSPVLNVLLYVISCTFQSLCKCSLYKGGETCRQLRLKKSFGWLTKRFSHWKRYVQINKINFWGFKGWIKCLLSLHDKFRSKIHVTFSQHAWRAMAFILTWEKSNLASKAQKSDY